MMRVTLQVLFINTTPVGLISPSKNIYFLKCSQAVYKELYLFHVELN